MNNKDTSKIEHNVSIYTLINEHMLCCFLCSTKPTMVICIYSNYHQAKNISNEMQHIYSVN